MSITLGYVIFYVGDVGRQLDFYEQAFDMQRRFLSPEGDYGEVATGQTALAFVDEELASSNLDAAGGYERLDPAGRPVGASITLTTDDVPAALARAVEHGARAYTEPTRKPWGQTVAYLIDPGGVLVELGTPVG